LRNLYFIFVILAALAAGVGCSSHSATDNAASAAAWKPGQKPSAGYAAIAAHAGAPATKPSGSGPAPAAKP
jgi:hypothetical protein